MRVGQNPAKTMQQVAQPEEVTVAVVTYLPTLGGYYAQGLEVLQTCLESIWAHTDSPFDLMVFDNGSCEQARAYLIEMHSQGRIQYLVLSRKNLGKAGAWNYIFGAAPGKYVAYADSDVYHYPGWLKPQVAVLETFPNAGMVTGMPMWTPEEYSTSTIAWAESDPDIRLERGRFLSWDDYWRHARSLGAEQENAREHFEVNDTICIFHGEERYFVGAAHFQFVAPKEVLQSVTPIPSRRPMGEVRMLDIALNERGYLRLATPQWWVQHMGNTLGEQFSPPEAESPVKEQESPLNVFWRWKPVEKALRWLYHASFEKLYRN